MGGLTVLVNDLISSSCRTRSTIHYRSQKPTAAKRVKTPRTQTRGNSSLETPTAFLTNPSISKLWIELQRQLAKAAIRSLGAVMRSRLMQVAGVRHRTAIQSGEIASSTPTALQTTRGTGKLISSLLHDCLRSRRCVDHHAAYPSKDKCA